MSKKTYKVRKPRRQIVQTTNGSILVIDDLTVVGSIDHWGDKYFAWNHYNPQHAGQLVSVCSTLDAAADAIPRGAVS